MYSKAYNAIEPSSMEKTDTLGVRANPRTPKVSVIVPVYKVEQYLSQCIESILIQTFTDFELLLIDDGSPDRSGVICDEYAAKDSRIRVFHKENGGVSSARNLGLDQARGEWITFVDSDDECINSLLAKLVTNTPNHLFIVGGYQTCYENGSRRVYAPKFKCKYSSSDYFILSDMNGYFFTNVNKLYKRDILLKNKILFKNDIHLGEDFIFNYEYINEVKDVFVLDSSDYIYYKRNNVSLSNKYHPNIFNANLHLIVIREQYFVKRELPSLYAKFLLKKKLSVCLETFFNLYKDDSTLNKTDRISNISRLKEYIDKNIKVCDSVFLFNSFKILFLVLVFRFCSAYLIDFIFKRK